MVELIPPSRYIARASNVLHQRRRILKRAYQEFNITKVLLTFAGGGDQGDLEDVEYLDANNQSVQIPEDFSVPDFTHSCSFHDLQFSVLHGAEIQKKYPDSIPRVEYRKIWMVEADMGFNLMEVCGEDGWWNGNGGRATIAWDLESDILDLEVIYYVITESPPERVRFQRGHITSELPDSAKLQLQLLHEMDNRLGFEITETGKF